MCPKGRDQGHTDKNVTESRLKSLFSKYPRGGYFPSRLCDHPAYYTPRQEGPPSWAGTREKRRGNCQRFPALADTQAPRVAARLQPSSTLAAPPLRPETSLGGGSGNRGAFLTGTESCPNWGQKGRMNNFTHRVRAPGEVRR